MAEVTITKTRTRETNPDASQTIKVVTTKETSEPAAKPLVATQINLQSYMLLGAICAVITWGIIEVIKEFVKARLKLKGKDKPWYYLATIRLSAVLVGAAAGAFLSDSFGLGINFAIAAGASAGAMSALVIRVIKAKAKKVTEGS